MRIGSKSLLLFGLVLSLAAGGGNVPPAEAQTLNASDYPAAPRIPYQGHTYTIVNGGVYEVQGTELVFLEQVYDPDYYAKHYQTVAGVTYRVVDASHRYPVLLSMADGFENATTIRDLVGPTRGFTAITLQSPKAPTVAQYVALRMSILVNGGNFLDNRIEPSSAQVRSGTRSLRAYAVPAGGGATVSKASLESELMHFIKGDDLWFSGWFYINQGTPRGIVDFETSYVLDDPGIRVLLDDSRHPRVELKWGTKPTYYSLPGTTMPFRQWFHLQVHASLSDGPDGRVDMWLDGRQVIGANGPTLPLPDILYDRLEIGITANEASTSEVFVDDMKVAKQPVS
jgi:hypothetical protein